MKSSKVRPAQNKTDIITPSNNEVFDTEVNLLTPMPDKGLETVEHSPFGKYAVQSLPNREAELNGRTAETKQKVGFEARPFPLG